MSVPDSGPCNTRYTPGCDTLPWLFCFPVAVLLPALNQGVTRVLVRPGGRGLCLLHRRFPNPAARVWKDPAIKKPQAAGSQLLPGPKRCLGVQRAKTEQLCGELPPEIWAVGAHPIVGAHRPPGLWGDVAPRWFLMGSQAKGNHPRNRTHRDTREGARHGAHGVQGGTASRILWVGVRARTLPRPPVTAGSWAAGDTQLLVFWAFPVISNNA